MFKLITVLLTLMVGSLRCEATYCADIDDEEVTNRPVDLKVALSVNKNAVCSWDNIKNYETLYTFETSESSANPEDTPLENLASECINYLKTLLGERLHGLHKTRNVDAMETTRIISKWSQFLVEYANNFYSKHKTNGQSLYDFLHPSLIGELALLRKNKNGLTAIIPRRAQVDVRGMLDVKINDGLKKKLKKLVAGSKLEESTLKTGEGGPCILLEQDFTHIYLATKALFKFLKDNNHVKSIVSTEKDTIPNLYSFTLLRILCANLSMDTNLNYAQQAK